VADLVKYRERFMVKPHAAVEIRVTYLPPEEGNPGLAPWYQCVTCADRLEWRESERFFECLSCGYQLTAEEATILCDDTIRSVQTLASITRKKRGFLWRLSRLFVGRTKRMSAL